MTTPFMPKGLNHESFGGVINIVPNQTDPSVAIVHKRNIGARLLLVDKKPARMI